jgi:DNA polymerase-3 subunit epsilon
VIDPHPKPKDRIAASKWAAGVVADNRRVVFLDTETTGLGNRDEIVQIAILDMDGQELCKTLVGLTRRKTVPRAASSVHGITKKDLEGKPTYAEISRQLQAVLKGKRIIAYNAEFDFRMMQQTHAIAGGYKPDPGQWECAMKVYAAFYGEIHPFFGDYKWQKLGGSHDATDDVVQLIRLVKRMAAHYETVQADARLRKEVLAAEARLAGMKAANTSMRALSTLRAFSYTAQELLDSTGIPAYLVLWMGGAMLSLLPLLLFGSLLGTLLAFLTVIGICVYFALRNPARKQQALARDREKLAEADAALAQTRRDLEAKKAGMRK